MVAFFVLSPKAIDLVAATPLFGSASRSQPWLSSNSFRPTSAMASGNPWILCATRHFLMRSGLKARLRGKCGRSERLLDGQARLGAHGLQGLALALWLQHLGARVTG